MVWWKRLLCSSGANSISTEHTGTSLQEASRSPCHCLGQKKQQPFSSICDSVLTTRSSDAEGVHRKSLGEQLLNESPTLVTALSLDMAGLPAVFQNALSKEYYGDMMAAAAKAALDGLTDEGKAAAGSNPASGNSLLERLFASEGEGTLAELLQCAVVQGKTWKRTIRLNAAHAGGTSHKEGVMQPPSDAAVSITDMPGLHRDSLDCWNKSIKRQGAATTLPSSLTQTHRRKELLLEPDEAQVPTKGRLVIPMQQQKQQQKQKQEAISGAATSPRLPPLKTTAVECPAVESRLPPPLLISSPSSPSSTTSPAPSATPRASFTSMQQAHKGLVPLCGSHPELHLSPTTPKRVLSMLPFANGSSHSDGDHRRVLSMLSYTNSSGTHNDSRRRSMANTGGETCYRGASASRHLYRNRSRSSTNPANSIGCPEYPRHSISRRRAASIDFCSPARQYSSSTSNSENSHDGSCCTATANLCSVAAEWMLQTLHSCASDHEDEEVVDASSTQLPNNNRQLPPGFPAVTAAAGQGLTFDDAPSLAVGHVHPSHITPQSERGSTPSTGQKGGATVVDDEGEDDAFLAGGEAQYWEVTAKTMVDEITGQRLLLLQQTDVTGRATAEDAMSDLTDAQLAMLSQIFPRHVLEFLCVSSLDKVPSNMGKLARRHDDVTILFMDIVGFTAMSKEVAPDAVMGFLNELFTTFDDLCDVYHVQKVETAGDCYIVAGGILSPDDEGFNQVDAQHDPVDSARRVMAFARHMMSSSKQVTMPHNGEVVSIRIGIHTGPCVSGLVGTKLPKFSIFGDSMNTASRMESTAPHGCIQVSSVTHELLLRGAAMTEASACPSSAPAAAAAAASEVGPKAETSTLPQVAAGAAAPVSEGGNESKSLLRNSGDEEWKATGGVEVKGKGVMETYIWVP